MAGSRIEPIATTVAGLDPETAANSAQARTPAMPRPPCRWPTHAIAKLIIRRATPPCVRKLPARMKNGIAMISNFSIPVNSFSATLSIGTSVIVNRNVSTVSPSEIEIGIPVSIRAISSPKMNAAVTTCLPSGGSRPSRSPPDWIGLLVEAFDLGVVGSRELTGLMNVQQHLQEAEAHQLGAERDAEIDDPHRHLEVGGDLLGMISFPDERGAQERHDPGEQGAGKQPEDDELAREVSLERR